MAKKRLTKADVAEILGVDIKTLNKEIQVILSDDKIKPHFGEYRKRIGFTEKQYSILKENSPLFDL